MNTKSAHLKVNITLVKRYIHQNLAMTVGVYGIAAIILFCVGAHWFYDITQDALYAANLPPAWQFSGDINHVLGTDNAGKDLFSYLIISYETTLLLTLMTTLFVIMLGALFNLVLFYMPKINMILSPIFRIFIAMPALISAIVMTILWANQMHLILLVVALSYLPRFVYSLHHKIEGELQKQYIIAYQLDGITKSKIFFFYVIPNIVSFYLSELVILIAHIMLTLTVLTFLGFGAQSNLLDLGNMMNQMLPLFKTSHWPFISSGLILVITIVVLTMFSFGLQTLLTRRV